jgi:hypothetical protein
MPIRKIAKSNRRNTITSEGKKEEEREWLPNFIKETIATKEIEAVICRAPSFTDQKKQRTD